MAIVRWEPFRELDRMTSATSSRLRCRARARCAAGCRRWTWSRRSDHFVLRADLPGLAEEDVKIEVEDRMLTISGERKTEHETDRRPATTASSARSARFSRSLTLPEGIDAEAITASFDRGVLEIRIPKPEQRKPRKISIGVGDTPKTIESEACRRRRVGAATPQARGAR